MESPRQTARSPLLDFQRSVLDRGCRVTVSSRAHFVLVDAWKRLTNFEDNEYPPVGGTKNRKYILDLIFVV